MKKLFVAVLTLTVLASCSSTKHQERQMRFLASGQLFSKFIRQLSTQTKQPQEALEQEIIAYIKSKSANNNHPNHVAIGITEDQAAQIKSLSDDLPFMPKVRKWAMENINKVNTGIDKKIAAEVYESIVVAEKNVINPYKTLSSNEAARRNRQKAISPISSISEKQERLLSSIRQLDNRSYESVLRKNLASLQERGATSPAVIANGQEIVESATTITRKTGLKAMGDGCESFTKTASIEVLEIKANIDIYRAQLVEQMANNKAGRTVANFKDIPQEARLTADELDTATKKAFQDVMGYTDDEAEAALKRLKGKPCNLY